MDTSNSSITNEEYALRLSVTIILPILIILSVVGNGLVCYVFYKQPQLQQEKYYPVISMAIADLLCGSLAMPFYIAKKHVRSGWWEGFTCDVFRFTYFFTEYASVLSLTAISVERFIAVSKPIAHRVWLTRRKMAAFLLASWFDAAAVSVLPFFWRRGVVNEPCIYDPTREWSLIVIAANVFTPYFIMLVCQVYAVNIALRYSRKRKLVRNTCANLQRNGIKRERDITLKLALVVGAFVICWGPSTLYYFIQMVCSQCFRPEFKSKQPVLNAVVKMLTFANSCINPLIYYWLNNTLRNAFLKSMLPKIELRKRKAEFMSRHDVR